MHITNTRLQSLKRAEVSVQLFSMSVVLDVISLLCIIKYDNLAAINILKVLVPLLNMTSSGAVEKKI